MQYLSDIIDDLRERTGYDTLVLHEDANDPRLMVKVAGMVVEVNEIEYNGYELIFKVRSE